MYSVCWSILAHLLLVDRSNGSKRFTLNLKKLDEFITPDHLKMEDICTATKLVSFGSFMANIDLRDGYHFIPIRACDSKYLRFSLKGQLLEFTCLPFGLCTQRPGSLQKF